MGLRIVRATNFFGRVVGGCGGGVVLKLRYGVWGWGRVCVCVCVCVCFNSSLQAYLY